MARYDGRINIPRTVQDDHYRYHMPTMKVKLEGKGNGKKTLLENIEAVSKSLERPATYVAKFICMELATKVEIDEKKSKYTLNGHHAMSSLEKALDAFIDRFVLCMSCRYPETLIEHKGESLYRRCMACGEERPIDMKHKFATFIQKQGKTKSTNEKYVKEERKKDAQRQAAAAAPSTTDEGDDFGDDWTDADFSTSAIETRRANLLGLEGVAQEGDPVDLLSDFLKTKPSVKAIGERLKSTSLINGWSKGNSLSALFGALCGKDMLTELSRKVEVLTHFVHSRQDRKRILYLTEKLASRDQAVSLKITHILNAYYEGKLIEEDLLLQWHKNPSKRIDADLGRVLRERSTAFITWLRTAEEDEE